MTDRTGISARERRRALRNEVARSNLMTMASLYANSPSATVYPPEDVLGRPMGSLRVSVTDRCNLRCQYCMPENDYVWLPREELLTFEEITRLVEFFTDLGVRDIHLTGGEPLLRRDLPRLVRLLARNPQIKDLALTTNGILLAEQAQALRDAGLHRITVSLDTLEPLRFRNLTRRDAHARVLEGIAVAGKVGFANIKLDTVVVKGVNDDELCDILEFSRERGIEARFIEYMDVGGATQWSLDQVVSRNEIIDTLSRRYGRIDAVIPTGRAPAERFLLPDGTVFGIVASTTAPFCQQCDRSRLTADGTWFLCLYALKGLDLRRMLRAGASPEEMQSDIIAAWQNRADHGAEERTTVRLRTALVGIEQLRGDPRLEMHTRGG